jgi:predicted N-formylglutamate amidohydrolase
LRGLGLAAQELSRHIAWDAGALEVARQLSVLLDAPLVHATVSRLVLDVNRDPSHPGSIVSSSEDTSIPGNLQLSAQQRRARVRKIYEPFHRTLAHIIESQSLRHSRLRLVSIHSFTPVYRGVRRVWHAGVLSAEDRRLADPLLAALRSDPDLRVGDNEPYAPTDGVYHTLGRQSSGGKHPSVLIELRADLIVDTSSQRRWAVRLQQALEAIH